MCALANAFFNHELLVVSHNLCVSIVCSFHEVAKLQNLDPVITAFYQVFCWILAIENADKLRVSLDWQPLKVNLVSVTEYLKLLLTFALVLDLHIRLCSLILRVLVLNLEHLQKNIKNHNVPLVGQKHQEGVV
jgi:hypothetical protein